MKSWGLFGINLLAEFKITFQCIDDDSVHQHGIIFRAYLINIDTLNIKLIG